LNTEICKCCKMCLHTQINCFLGELIRPLSSYVWWKVILEPNIHQK
jgi:hypothetical protein